MGAAEGEEDAAWLYLFEGFPVESGVAFEGIAQGVLVFGEGWRVEYDEVVGCLHLVEELEGVFCIGGVARGVGEVDGDVGICEVDGLLGGVD